MKCVLEGRLVDVTTEKTKDDKFVDVIYVYSDRETIRIPGMKGKKEDIGKIVNIPIYERVRTYQGEMYRSILPVTT
ncbi:MAG: hypothetical protein IJO73_07440 [Clostridia bacterium]|nr:hypothetical protein [Clostridia bacterium]